MATIIQIRDSFRLNSFASIIMNRLQNKGLIKLLGGVSEKHLAEDTIKEFLKQVLEIGINDYDVVTLAGEQISKDIKTNDTLNITACKEADGQWRLNFQFDRKHYSIRKEDVINLAVEAYREEATKVLEKY